MIAVIGRDAATIAAACAGVDAVECWSPATTPHDALQAALAGVALAARSSTGYASHTAGAITPSTGPSSVATPGCVARSAGSVASPTRTTSVRPSARVAASARCSIAGPRARYAVASRAS